MVIFDYEGRTSDRDRSIVEKSWKIGHTPLPRALLASRAKEGAQTSYGRKSKTILGDHTFFFFPSLNAQKINSRDSNEQNNDTDTDDNYNHLLLVDTRSLLGPTRDPHSSACRFLSGSGVRFSWHCNW